MVSIETIQVPAASLTEAAAFTDIQIRPIEYDGSSSAPAGGCAGRPPAAS
jgi:hypothetical protein